MFNVSREKFIYVAKSRGVEERAKGLGKVRAAGYGRVKGEGEGKK